MARRPNSSSSDAATGETIDRVGIGGETDDDARMVTHEVGESRAEPFRREARRAVQPQGPLARRRREIVAGRLHNPERPTEAFGLFALSGKATAFLAPALITVFTAMTGSAQQGYIPVIILFLLGLILLRWVNKDGDREEWSGSQQLSPS